MHLKTHHLGIATALMLFALSSQAANTFPSSGNAGIGTTTPAAPLHIQVNSNGLNLAVGVRNLNGVEGGNAVGIGFLNEVNGNWWKAALVHTRTAGYGVGSLQFLVNNDMGSSSTVSLSDVRMTITSAGNVGIGTSSPTQKLSVNGTIRAKEIIVDSGWADHVFTSEYRLASLAEIEKHIEVHGHLPDLPSDKEVATHGVSVAEVQVALLRKIEELTLHMIEHEKAIDVLKRENALLRRELKAAVKSE